MICSMGFKIFYKSSPLGDCNWVVGLGIGRSTRVESDSAVGQACLGGRVRSGSTLQLSAVSSP